ncbi:response regulator transcription factor [soil metagenome]
MDVLLVEDDRKIAANVQRGLQAEGMTVKVSHDGLDGLRRATTGTYDLIVLDIMLPGLNGYEVCARLRNHGIVTPILMLTAKDGEYDEAEGLDTGADDYMTKPFSYTVLLARIRALTRRREVQQRREICIDRWRIDPSARRVWKDDQEVALSTREFEVLSYFAEQPGQVLSKGQILDAVWDQAFDGDDNIVEVYISRLRRRLGEEVLLTVRGAGYRMADGR